MRFLEGVILVFLVLVKSVWPLVKVKGLILSLIKSVSDLKIVVVERDKSVRLCIRNPDLSEG